MRKKIKYLFAIIICFLAFTVPAYSKEVGLHDTPYSISKAYPTAPAESTYSDLEYSDWQSTGDFNNLFENGYYVIRVRDKLGNTSYFPFQITGLSMLFDVEYIDLADDRSVLGSVSKLVSVGTLVSGADLGTDTAFSKYYDGYTYESCTGTTVSAFEKNIVYRNFKIRTYELTYHNITGDVFGSESVRHGNSAAFQSVPIKESEAGTSETKVYTFKGWGDKDGNLVDITSVKKSMDLYPVFKEEVVPNTVTLTFHYNDANNTIVYLTGKRGEIEPPEPTREDLLNETGTYWYSFEYWTTQDGQRVFDLSALMHDTDLYAYYSEIFVPVYEKPIEEENTLELKEPELIDTSANNLVLAEDTAIVKFIDDIENNKTPIGLIKIQEVMDNNKTAVTSVATVGILAALLSLLTHSVLGIGIVQGMIFLWALFKKNKRYVKGVWLYGNPDIKYVDKFGREIIVTKDKKGWHYTTKKGKSLYGVDVKTEFRKLEACRITKKELMANIKESEVYTVFNKDVRIAYGNVQNTNRPIGFNMLSGFRTLGENINYYSMKIVSGGKEFAYDLTTDAETL